MSRLADYADARNFRVPDRMKAVVLSGIGFDNLSVEEVPVPPVGANQLLCRVDAAGVCTSLLKLIAQGPKHTFINGWDLAAFPVIIGDEGALTVVRAGRNLAGKYRPGQRFGVQPAVDVPPVNHRDRYANSAEGMKKVAVGYTLGGNLAEYMLIQEEVLDGQCLLPLPDADMPYFAVSMAEPISCVYSAQERHIHIYKDGPHARRTVKLGLLPGGTAVVIGAGAMGMMHVELAMRFKPRNLIVSDVIPERLEKVRGLLADKARAAGVNLLASTRTRSGIRSCPRRPGSAPTT